MCLKGPIRNTHTQYAIRSVPQRPDTQYAYAIRNTQCASKGLMHNTQYAIRNTQPCSQQASGVAPHTQYAIRNTQPCSQQAFERRTPYAIRNTQYAIRNVPHRALLSIRKTLPQYAVAQYAAYTVCDTSPFTYQSRRRVQQPVSSAPGRGRRSARAAARPAAPRSTVRT